MIIYNNIKDRSITRRIIEPYASKLSIRAAEEENGSIKKDEFESGFFKDIVKFFGNIVTGIYSAIQTLWSYIKVAVVIILFILGVYVSSNTHPLLASTLGIMGVVTLLWMFTNNSWRDPIVDYKLLLVIGVFALNVSIALRSGQLHHVIIGGILPAIVIVLLDYNVFLLSNYKSEHITTNDLRVLLTGENELDRVTGIGYSDGLLAPQSTTAEKLSRFYNVNILANRMKEDGGASNISLLLHNYVVLSMIMTLPNVLLMVKDSFK